MKIVAIAAIALGLVANLSGQETGIHVRSIRVLATDPEALAVFYEKAFGMAEIRRPANSPSFKEIVINSGMTTEVARTAISTPLVITTRPPGSPAGAMASLILQVPDLDRAVESATRNGGHVLRPPAKSSETQSYAFVNDPDGNQIELVMSK